MAVTVPGPWMTALMDGVMSAKVYTGRPYLHDVKQPAQIGYDLAISQSNCYKLENTPAFAPTVTKLFMLNLYRGTSKPRRVPFRSWPRGSAHHSRGAALSEWTASFAAWSGKKVRAYVASIIIHFSDTGCWAW